MQTFDHQTLEIALFFLVALALLVQAFVMLAAFLALRKAAQSMNDKISAFHASVTPLIESVTPIVVTSRDLLTKLAPRIDSASEDLAAMTKSLRAQTADLQAAADEVVARAKTQAGRLDSILTNVFDAMDRAGGFMADCINKPMRQFSALLASVKAVVESLRTSAPVPRSQSNHAPGDNDMFV